MLLLLLIYLCKLNIVQVVSFDSYGISGHRNHQSLGIALVAGHPDVPVWRLQSSTKLGKFSSLLGLPFALASHYVVGNKDSAFLLSSPADYRIARTSYNEHRSQGRWFRNAYCLTSTYMWWNRLQRAGGSDGAHNDL